jgi:hypothetical protein
MVGARSFDQNFLFEKSGIASRLLCFTATFAVVLILCWEYMSKKDGG